MTQTISVMVYIILIVTYNFLVHTYVRIVVLHFLPEYMYLYTRICVIMKTELNMW